MSPAMTSEQLERAQAMRAHGTPYAVIAAEMGVSCSGVRYRLTGNAPSRRRISEAEITAMRELRAEGLTLQEIADRFGVNSKTVSYHTNTEPEPDRIPLTPDDLLVSAFPWAIRLSHRERNLFGYELAHRPKGAKEADVDRFILRWRHEAERRAT